MMSKLLIRIMFCLIPAFAVGFPVGLFHVVLGLIFGIGIFCLGWQVTAPKPDRGEF
jgi:phosphate/sulfate permease